VKLDLSSRYSSDACSAISLRALSVEPSSRRLNPPLPGRPQVDRGFAGRVASSGVAPSTCHLTLLRRHRVSTHRCVHHQPLQLNHV
jgi:hypothetical protein